MAFSEGQLNFAIVFLLLFIGVMIYAYRSDIKQLGTQSEGALKVLAIIVFVMAIFYGTVKLLAG